MRAPSTFLAIAAAILLLPTSLFAQASLTGIARDASGGVLPGVTVEAASPALIEKIKSAVTDDGGQYRIIDLRPGTYSVTFTLPGFSTVKREGLELTGTQTLTIPVEMRVGGIEETITVTGEAPVVDVQNARREVVMQDELIQSLPAARAAGAVLNATPGLTVDNNGVALSPTMTFFSARGGPAGEGRMAIGGMTVAAARSGGVSSYVYDTPNAEEVAITVGGGLGESDIGGPVMNMVPRSGGNTFSGGGFLNLAGDWSRGDNLDDELRAFGLTQTPGIQHAHDASVSFGGPILRNRLWFYSSYRTLSTQTAVEGITANANTGDASRWDWVGSPIDTRLVQDRQMIIGRVTGQFGKSRIQFNSEYQHRCEGTPLTIGTDGCHKRGEDWIGLGNNSPAQSPEATGTAARGYFDWPFYLNQATWTMPATSKLLLEGGFTLFRYNPAFGYPPPDGITSLIPVTEQSNAINPATGQPFAPTASYTYRGLEQWGYAQGKTNGWRAAASYVTGAHSMKIGYQGDSLDQLDQTLTNEAQLAYRFSQGVPNAVTYRLPDYSRRTITNLTGVYIQDSYTRDRLTIAGALRYDRVTSYSPVAGNGTTRTSWANAAPISIEETKGVDAYNDITPRFGVAYDLFGNGTTALKFNGGRYLGFAANDPPYTSNNPAANVVFTVTNRGWTDTNRNYVVDCDLTNPAVQNTAASGGDICAAAIGNDANFGKPGAATRVNPEVLSGWGKRPHDYQWTGTVQQQLRPGVSAEFSYTYRTFHRFFVTDDLNRPVGTSYETYTLTAPQDARLPNGGGFPVTVYVPTVAAAAVASQRYLTWETDFGPERDSSWKGFDVTVNARLRGGLMTSVGTSTGRAIVDRCATITQFNNIVGTTINGPDPRGCRNIEPFQTTLRGLASYTIPRVDVLVSATLRSQAPMLLGNSASTSAQWVVPNSVIVGALGRLPSGAVATGNTTIQLSDDENRVYADNRRTQVDMRLAKILRFGRTRSDIGVDLNNLLNTNYPTSYNTTYTYGQANGGSYGNPTGIYSPRFMRLNFTLNF